METRRLGGSELDLTVTGFGSWAVGGGGWAFGWGPQDDDASIRAIHAALDAGINWIDTAAVYGFGHSEEVVGRAVKGLAVRPIIATKCGRIGQPDGGIAANLSPASIRAECDASLQRLGAEVIDLYQLHWPDPDEAIEEAWGTVGELIKAGKVRWGGVSNFNAEQLARCHAIHPIASLQPPYSLLKRGIESDALPYCREHNIGIIAYSPMQKGLLTGKVSSDWVAGLAEDDHRRRDPMFAEPQLSPILEKVARFADIAGELGVTPAQLAVAWVIHRDGITSAIVGGRTAEQAASAAKAGQVQIAADRLAAIGDLFPA